MQPRWALLVVGVLGALLLTSCTYTSAGPVAGGWCVPLVSVEPGTVVAGDTVTVVIESGCDADAPAGGWTILAAPVGDVAKAVRTTVDADVADGFEVEMQLPADFPTGAAFAGVSDWDYSACPDNASCASPTGDFTAVGAAALNRSADLIAASRALSIAPASR